MTPCPALLLVPILLSLGCNGPLALAPGGQLEGPTAPTPANWSFTDDVATVELETLPAAPYSVNIWVIALDDHLYVHAGANRARWIENMATDPNVRIRIDGTIYELAAAGVEGQEEFDRFSDSYERKYGNRPRNENVAEAYLFRLKAR